jgi:flagellar biosynthetic protein FliR
MHGAITVETAWLMGVLLLSLRLAPLFLLTPLLGAAGVPVIVRVLLVVGLAAGLFMGLPGVVESARSAVLGIDGVGALIGAGFTEVALGATLALGIHLAFAAFAVAGQLLGIQIGFGLGRVLDPASSATVPILTSAFNALGVLVFFMVDGQHALLRGVAYSLERFPLGRPWPLEAAFAPILRQFAGLFSLGFALAAPVVFCILLVEMALGVVARNLPQINMLALGIPVKIVVGLLALSLWFGGVGGVMTRVYASIYRTWDAIFAVVSDAARTGALARLPVPQLADAPSGVESC